MGTCNFSFENICVAVGVGEEWEDYHYDDLKESVVDDLGEAFKKVWGTRATDADGSDYDRNYSGSRIAEVDINHPRDFRVYRRITIWLRSGYYEGACLDYEIEEVDDCSDLRGTKTLDKHVDKCEKIVSSVLKRHGDELQVSARFSNGETWYNKVK